MASRTLSSTPSTANAAEDGKENAQSVWLNAWHDPVAGIKTYTSCVRMADLNGDGDWKLLIADLDRKLKVYRGTALISEHALLDTPCAIATFYSDANVPRIPSVAVAAGPHIFIYRNLRPYYKFTLPSLEIDRQETEVWGDLRSDKIDGSRAQELLVAARDNGVQLTSQSLDFLTIDDPGARQEFVESHKHAPLVQQTVITCLEVIKKNMEDDDAISSLVVGTESRDLMILDPSGASILTKVKLGNVPSFIAVTGLFDVDYRIVVACRDGKLYTIKNGEVTGTVIELESQPCGLVRTYKSIVVGCMGNVIHSFHIKGKKNFSIYLPSPITNMELLSLQKSRNLRAVLVSLQNGEIRIYNEKHLVSNLQTRDVITGLRFGRYGREDSTLVIAFKSGALSIKMLPRLASLEVAPGPAGPPPEQDIPLNIPKKTKLYVELTQRERDQAVEMHRIFQRDLCKLRLSTARAYVKVLTDGQGPLSYTAGSCLRLNAQVQGLGPLFKIKLSIQNTGNRPIFNTPVVLTFNEALYKVRHSPFFTIPLLIPGLMYKYEVELDALDKQGAADAVNVFVCSSGRSSVVPVISAAVSMPVSEVLD
eukprot:CAMPEP_0184664068 /NCGR_PEP_ID=MMETSP0308-20130426/51076_1 /TAXON_ID=38269 /ORGANISM="Gloeochaete witrockiana, Strain SAG 46.84" /LENGTH=592 /DNA_ID=CAMNT_0027107225 /DNA_START=108 /DNA_END=1886 /DNA_ORIENTATION=+